MAGELVGEAADFAPTHSIRLARDRKWSHAWFANPTSYKMAIDNGIDLVRACRGLVDALRVDGDGSLGCGKKLEECLQITFGQTGEFGCLR